MKRFKLLFASILTFSCLVTPVKNANAGLILSLTNPASAVGTVVFLSGWTVGSGSWLVGYIRQESGVYGPLDKYIENGFFAGLAVAMLDAEMDGLQQALETKYPSIPSYIIDEAIFTMKEKADLKDFNEEGLKSVSMGESEFQELSKAIPRDVDQEELESFRRLLTDKVNL